MKICNFDQSTPRGRFFSEVNYKISFFSLRKIYGQLVLALQPSTDATNDDCSGFYMRVWRLPRNMLFGKLWTATPPPSAVRQSKYQLPDLLHQVAISFPSLTDQQQTTVVKELANLSQQVPDVLREPPSVQAKGRPPNSQSTKRDPSGFEYVDTPSKETKPKRRKVTCGACNQVGHCRDSRKFPLAVGVKEEVDNHADAAADGKKENTRNLVLKSAWNALAMFSFRNPLGNTFIMKVSDVSSKFVRATKPIFQYTDHTYILLRLRIGHNLCKLVITTVTFDEGLNQEGITCLSVPYCYPAIANGPMLFHSIELQELKHVRFRLALASPIVLQLNQELQRRLLGPPGRFNLCKSFNLSKGFGSRKSWILLELRGARHGMIVACMEKHLPHPLHKMFDLGCECRGHGSRTRCPLFTIC
ncbi:hypothetical protein PsorP6_002777 [Peronosclerospora sorghi]|uniref:Uncharacterized protein n=1 Tax=Peronosclerospora sorghi TaxID=230839 RepID=A0ACC0VRJ5_9STRA|nr:hypothetical protein PsorP6_002777 [Peronosclerospora sorghi]